MLACNNFSAFDESFSGRKCINESGGDINEKLFSVFRSTQTQSHGCESLNGHSTVTLQGLRLTLENYESGKNGAGLVDRVTEKNR